MVFIFCFFSEVFSVSGEFSGSLDQPKANRSFLKNQRSNIKCDVCCSFFVVFFFFWGGVEVATTPQGTLFKRDSSQN